MSDPVTRPELDLIAKLFEAGMNEIVRKVDELRGHMDASFGRGSARMDELDGRISALENDAREERAARKALVSAGRIIWGLLGAGGGGALFWIAGLISKGLHP